MGIWRGIWGVYNRVYFKVVGYNIHSNIYLKEGIKMYRFGGNWVGGVFGYKIGGMYQDIGIEGGGHIGYGGYA